jgi:hypothetical protein
MAGRLYDQIRTGALDRSLLTDEANAYLSGEVLSDYAASFAQLGKPIMFMPVGSEKSRGVSADTWLVVWPTTKLIVTLRTRADGKVEEFFAYPVEEVRRQPADPVVKPHAEAARSAKPG